MIGRYVAEIKIVIELDKTGHASERQTRHDDFNISDDIIRKTASKALRKIANLLVHDKLDLEEEFVIHDEETDMNLVGVMREKNAMPTLVIITVMKKRDFRPKSGSKLISV